MPSSSLVEVEVGVEVEMGLRLGLRFGLRLRMGLSFFYFHLYFERVYPPKVMAGCQLSWACELKFEI